MTAARSLPLVVVTALGMLSDGFVVETPTARAQPVAAPAAGESGRTEPARLSTAPASVESLLSAGYLSPDQRKDARIRFGRYTPEDLDTPARVARAALLRGALLDPALAASDTDADPIDRAEGAWLRGEFAAARALLDGANAALPRAVWIRASMLEQEGKFDEALAALGPVLKNLESGAITEPDEIVHAVSLAAMRIRLRGPGSTREGAAAGDYKALVSRLDDIINSKDRLSWPAHLAQAELLAARDNKQEAAAAISRALDLNPACARAWAMLGRLMVEGFSFAQAEAIAKRLDVLSSDWPGPEGGDPDPLPEDVATQDPGAGSAEGAMIIARAMLRQSEGAQAVKLLEPHLAKQPSSPRLLALRCAALAVSFDFKAADAALAEFDAQFGRSPLAQYETGRALSDSRQYGPSQSHLEEAARRQPFAPEPHIELGLMLMQAGKDADALRALEKAFALDPFNARADNSLRLARELQSYERIETPHYVIRCKPGANTDGGPSDLLLARDMAAPLERNYAIVTGSQDGGIDFQPTEKTVIDLMPDHRWFGVRIAGMPAIHTIAASTGPVIAMESPRDGPNHLGTYDWVRVLRHEFVHTVTLGRTKNRIPHWFTEASAVYLELSPRDWQTCQLLAAALRQNKLFDFTDINLAFIRPKRPTDRSQAYAQGHWMYQYIVERSGARAPLELMDKYAAGVREEEAFQSVIGISRAQFLADFTKWAREQVIEWGLDVPEGTPQLRSLLAREALLSADGLDADSKLALQRIADGHPTEDDDGVDLPEPTPAMVAKWLEQHPRHPDVLELAVDDAVKASNGRATPATEPLIERYAAARPVDPKPHRLLAKMYLDAAAQDAANLDAQAKKVIPHLEFLDHREQKAPTYAMELARRYAALGDFEKASAKAERATQIDPFNAPTRELAATIALQAKDFATAERHIEALTQIEPAREIHKQRLEAVRAMRARNK